MMKTSVFSAATLIAMSLGAFFGATKAEAHDWYSKSYDPVTHGWCCNTSNGDGYGDCSQLILEPGVLTGEVGGYRLRLTAEQAQRINPLRREPVDTFIPEERIQPSQDGNWHVCLPASSSTTRNDFFCFFQPPGY